MVDVYVPSSTIPPMPVIEELDEASVTTQAFIRKTIEEFYLSMLGDLKSMPSDQKELLKQMDDSTFKKNWMQNVHTDPVVMTKHLLKAATVSAVTSDTQQSDADLAKEVSERLVIGAQTMQRDMSSNNDDVKKQASDIIIPVGVPISVPVDKYNVPTDRQALLGVDNSKSFIDSKKLGDVIQNIKPFVSNQKKTTFKTHMIELIQKQKLFTEVGTRFI